MMKPEQRGLCGECRHANQQTMDAAEGLWACPWIGTTFAVSPCDVKFKATGDYAFELFDGTNCTWNPSSDVRALPTGYEHLEVEVTSWTFDFESWFESWFS